MEVSAEMKLTIGLVTMNRERQVAEAIQSAYSQICRMKQSLLSSTTHQQIIRKPW